MGVIQVSGQVLAGPPSGTGVCQDRSILQVALALKGGAGSKNFQVATGFLQLQIATGAGVYQALPGVGPAPGVTQADTLYFFASSAMLVRLTQRDPAGGADIVSVLTVDGLVVHEFQSSGYLKLLEVSGSGTIEYFASGSQ